MCDCISIFRLKELEHWTSATEISAGVSQTPDTQGVYVLRASRWSDDYLKDVRSRYFAEIKNMYEYKTEFFAKLGLLWKPDRNLAFVTRRLERLSRIEIGDDSMCQILYIGSSGSISRRLEALLCKEDSHTIDHPVRALLLAKWQVECAYKYSPNPPREEEELKAIYKAQHGGKLPPLVER